MTFVKEAELRAKEANKAKNRFLSNISHELRTPLNGVMGFAQLISMSPGSDISVREYAEHIHASAEHLLGLINELLDFSRIEAGTLSIEVRQSTLDEVLRTVVELVHVRARQKGIQFESALAVSHSQELYTDVRRLRQVLLNLLSNAVKFTRHGRVALRVFERENRLHFEVHDEGIGIAQENLSMLFQPFSQVGDTSFRSQGLGLGLAISQQIVQALGGEITVRSALGQGSVFSFSLPCLQASGLQQPVGATLQLPPYFKKLKVLYVEDDEHGRELMQEFLRRSQIELYVAEDAGTAMEFGKQANPDLVLLDLNLPDMSGFDLMARIRQTPWGSDKPVIAVSADHLPPTRERAFDSGAAEFVAKPIDLQLLQQVIGRFAEQLP